MQTLIFMVNMEEGRRIYRVQHGQIVQVLTHPTLRVIEGAEEQMLIRLQRAEKDEADDAHPLSLDAEQLMDLLSDEPTTEAYRQRWFSRKPPTLLVRLLDGSLAERTLVFMRCEDAPPILASQTRTVPPPPPTLHPSSDEEGEDGVIPLRRISGPPSPHAAASLRPEAPPLDFQPPSAEPRVSFRVPRPSEVG